MAPAAEFEVGSSAAAVAGRLWRLERRLELERRQSQKQLQRMERRMQDLFQTPAPNAGRWAELQGYVDGLAETVQGLLSRAEHSAPASPPRGGSDLGTSGYRALSARMDAVTEDLAGMGARLLEAEQGVAALAEAELEGRLQDLEQGLWARVDGLEQGLEDLAAEAGGGALEDSQPSRDVAELCEQVAELRGRMRILDRRAGSCNGTAAALAAVDAQELREGLGQLREQVSSLQTNSRRDSEALQAAVADEQVAELRAELEGQLGLVRGELAKLGTWAQDVDCEMRKQDARQRVDRVGECVLRMSCAEGAGSAAAVAAETQGLREELARLGEQLAGLRARVRGAEVGLEDAARAVGCLRGSVEELREGRPAQALQGGAGQGARELEEQVEFLSRRTAALEAQCRDLAARLAVAEGGAGREAAEARDLGDVLKQVRSQHSEVNERLLRAEHHLGGLSDLGRLKEEVSDLRAQLRGMPSGPGSPPELREVQEAVVQLHSRLEELESGHRNDSTRQHRLGDSVQVLREELESGRRQDSAKLQQLEGGLQLLREDVESSREGDSARLQTLESGVLRLREEHSRLSAGSQQQLEASERSLEASLEARLGRQREELEERLGQLEAHVQRLAEPEDLGGGARPASPEPDCLRPRGMASISLELRELRATSEELRERQAELAISLDLRAQDGERCREALAGLQDVRGQLERLGRQLPEIESRSREARRGVEELAGEVQGLSGAAVSVAGLDSRLRDAERRLVEVKETSSVVAPVPLLEARLCELERGLAEARELSGVASSVPALEAELREMERGLSEVRGLCSSVGSVPAIEARVRDMERELAKVRELCSSVGSMPALEAHVSDMERELAKVREASSVLGSVPALEARLRETELGLAEVRDVSSAASSVPALQVELREVERGLAEVMELSGVASKVPALEACLQKMEQRLEEVGEHPGDRSLDPELEARVAELESRLAEEAAARVAAVAELRDLAGVAERLGSQNKEVSDELGARLSKLEEVGEESADLAALRGQVESSTKRHIGLDSDLHQTRSSLQDLASRVDGLARLESLAEDLQHMGSQQGRRSEELADRLQKLEETTAQASAVAELRDHTESIGQRHQSLDADFQQAKSDLKDLTVRFTSIAEIPDLVEKVSGQQVEIGEELGARVRAMEERMRHVEALCRQQVGDISTLLETCQSSERSVRRLGSLEDALRPMGCEVSALQKQLEDLKQTVDIMQRGHTESVASFESRLRGAERSSLGDERCEELRSELQALDRGQGSLEEGLLEARRALEELVARPSVSEEAVADMYEASLAFQRFQTDRDSKWSKRLQEVERHLEGSEEETERLRGLPPQVDRLTAKHEEAEASLQEAMESVEALAAKVQQLSAPGGGPCAGHAETSPGKGSTRCDPEQMRDVHEQLGFLRGEVSQLRVHAEESSSNSVDRAESQEMREAQGLQESMAQLQQQQVELGASCESRLQQVERGVHESAGLRELKRQVQELAEAAGRARGAELRQAEQASDIGARLRDAERRLGEALRGQLDRAWWQHADELASGLSRAEDRGLRQASVLEELAGQLNATREQFVDLRTQVEEVVPALEAALEVHELKGSIEEVRAAQAELSARLEHLQHEAAPRRAGRAGAEEDQEYAGEEATWRRAGPGVGKAFTPRPRREETPGGRAEKGHETPAASAARGQGRAAPYTPRDPRASASTEPAAGPAAPSDPAEPLAEPGPGGSAAALGGSAAGGLGRRRSASAEGDALAKSTLEQARVQARERLVSATQRLQPQSARSAREPPAAAGAGSSSSPPMGGYHGAHFQVDGSQSPVRGTSCGTDVEHISKELTRRARIEAHRAEALDAVEARVGAITERVEDVCVRLDEAENGLDAAGRGGMALRLRFEQLQSLLDVRLHTLSSEISEVASRQLVAERGLADMASESVRARLEAQLRPLSRGPGRARELQAVADRQPRR